MLHADDRLALGVRRSHVEGNAVAVVKDLHRALRQFANYLFADEIKRNRILVFAARYEVICSYFQFPGPCVRFIRHRGQRVHECIQP